MEEMQSAPVDSTSALDAPAASRETFVAAASATDVTARLQGDSAAGASDESGSASIASKESE